MKNSKCLIVGYHGMENFGDDIFLETVVYYIRQHADVDLFYVTAPCDFPLMRIDGVSFQGIYPSRIRIKKLDFLWNCWYFMKSDLCIVAAGSLSVGHRQILNTIFFLFTKYVGRNFGKSKVIGIGLSLGPFSGSYSSWIAKWGYKCFGKILVRDVASFEWAVRSNIKNLEKSNDLATLNWQQYQMIRSEVAFVGSKTLGISIGPGFHRNTEEMEKFCLKYGSFCKSLKDEGVIIRTLVFSTCNSDIDGDVEIANTVSKLLLDIGIQAKVVEYTSETRLYFLERLLSCDGLISSRLHPGLICSGVGIVVMQISASMKKVYGVYNQIGITPCALAECVVPNDEEWLRFKVQLLTVKANKENVKKFEYSGKKLEEQVREILLF